MEHTAGTPGLSPRSGQASKNSCSEQGVGSRGVPGGGDNSNRGRVKEKKHGTFECQEILQGDWSTE